jgi:hypothetical protein
MSPRTCFAIYVALAEDIAEKEGMRNHIDRNSSFTFSEFGASYFLSDMVRVLLNW